MKIIIAGAGAVGTHLAKLFSRERHDITLIDTEPTRLQSLSARFDLLTICESPRSIETLRSADVGRADLFISVTPDEAHNMTICMLASKLGAQKTVARVDNYEYTLPRNLDFLKSVGINSVIYPEMLAGEEIMHTIQRSWVRQLIEVQKGALQLICVKVRNGASVVGRPLREISTPDSPYHVVAVKRHGETLIPGGNDSLKNQDIVYFMTTAKYISYIKEITGKEDYPDVTDVMFLGGGSTTERALAIMPDYMRAKVFDSDATRLEHLDSVLMKNNVMYINGDGHDLDLLIDEGIKRTQAFVATTDSSETNVLSCLAAKRLGVRKTVAMVENSDYIAMAESLDIGTILNKKTIAAGHIYQMMLRADVTTVKSLTIANADVAEFVVKEGAPIAKKVVKDLGLPSGVTLGGMVREKKGYLINGLTQLKTGDVVVAFCTEGKLKQIEKFFR